jgi:CDP-diacylglycerol--serine O-phosphatidyltransferase
MARRNRNSRRRKSREQWRRGIYVLPNLFTTASLFAGFFAMVEAIQGNFMMACLAILASLVFDGLDGKVARATKTVSRFGVEFDSLSDLVAFGVAPAILVYMWGLQPLGRLGFLAAFLFVACGALRLARFNVQVEEVGTSHFVGLPIPAAASVVCTLILMWLELGGTTPFEPWALVVIVFLLSFLMVSNIHYLSFKEMGLGKLKSFNWLVAALLLFVLIAIQPQFMGFIMLASYVIGGPFAARIMAKKKAAKAEAAARLQATEQDRLPLS